MRIIKEFKCPHCNKKIQYIQIRRPTTVRKVHNNTFSLSMRKGIYEYRKG